METILADVLVIGGGAAAARAAVEAAGLDVLVHLVDKGTLGESGTSPPCLRGFATTLNEQDSPEQFFHDWISSSGLVSDQNLVREAILHSQQAVEGLEAIGMEFLTDADGSRMLYRGAGQTVARGLTAKFHGPEGRNVVRVLCDEARNRGVRIHENIMITRLLHQHGQVRGAVGVSPHKELFVFSAKTVILASGGANRIFPNVASEIADAKYRTTGDSFSLAFAAGAPLIDLEFAQFRESPPGASRFGGRYLNAVGERFMDRYAPEALEKAPRHKVVEAVYREIKAQRGPIVWEVGGISKAEQAGIDIAQRYVSQKRIEVGIDFQRLLGGVRVNERAETLIPGLFAAGESSGGVHGGGRMQGNAFLETQVFGMHAGRNAAERSRGINRADIEAKQVYEEQARIASIAGEVDPAEIIRTVQQTMWDQVGIVRDGHGLQDAVAKFEKLKQERVPRLSGDDIFAALEAANLLLTAEMVANAALKREETRGAHIRSDFPHTNDHEWLKHVCITNRRGEMAISTVPIVTEQT